MSTLTDFGLPVELLDLCEFTPTEDILLAILRGAMPAEIPVYSLIPDEIPNMFVLVRRVPNFGDWTGDERFIDRARFFVHTFTSDPDGDEKGALLSEAIRVMLRNTSRARPVLPGLGTVVRIKMNAEPNRKTDWANSAGPVQFADLPTGMWRYEAQYTITVRKPR